MIKKRWREWQKSLREVKQIVHKTWDNQKCEYKVLQLLDTKAGDKVDKVEFETFGKEERAIVHVSRLGKPHGQYLLFREWINNVIFE